MLRVLKRQCCQHVVYIDPPCVQVVNATRQSCQIDTSLQPMAHENRYGGAKGWKQKRDGLFIFFIARGAP
jgi:ribosomal protein L4